MQSFSQFLLNEGGNVKVGDVSANNIDLHKTKRRAVQSHVSGMLMHLHNSFKKETGEHLFGPKAGALKSGEIFSGSTKALMSHSIPHDTFTKHKPSVGDIDVKIPAEHAEKLMAHMSPGRKFGKYTIVGSKRGGTEIHTLMRHENGEVHQVDFEKTRYEHGAPDKFEQFSHSAHWSDIRSGIKGAHHKILLNAIGGEKFKFASSKGLMSRVDDKMPPIRDTKHITASLFGPHAKERHLHSFKGLVHLIKHHIPRQEHQQIVDKFVSGVKGVKSDNGPAKRYISKALGINPTIQESKDTEDHHASVIPLTGFSPISHMGHAEDLGNALKSLPGTKHVGVSNKADAFTPEERSHILKKQWGLKSTKVHYSHSAGDVVSRVHKTMPAGRKHLHMLVGSDRLSMAQSLKKALEAGKIPEMNGKKFDSITIHTPTDGNRSHGMSGTKMRMAAHKSDIESFHKHLGPMFSRSEATKVMNKIKKGIDAGSIPLKR